jgi:SAM-dependent methyltransferase
LENTMNMDAKEQAPLDQAALWNGPAARAWVGAQDLLDQVLLPFEPLLVAAAREARPRRVLDVGCGTGGTTLALARELGPQAQCVGVDISQPMITNARERAQAGGSSAAFVCADAQAHAFETGAFDLVVSRFGVMFFQDPVLAFANLHRAAAPGARLFCLAWRGPQENPFMTAAERVAAPLLPDLPPRRAGAPGQFAFADRTHVQHVLAAAGWRDIEVRPVDVACRFPARDLERYFTTLGPVGLALQAADEHLRQSVTDVLQRAFAPFVHSEEVHFTAACWTLEASSA